MSHDLAILETYSVAIALLGGFTGRFIADSFSGDPFIDLRAVEVEGNARAATLGELALEQIRGFLDQIKVKKET